MELFMETSVFDSAHLDYLTKNTQIVPDLEDQRIFDNELDHQDSFYPSFVSYKSHSNEIPTNKANVTELDILSNCEHTTPAIENVKNINEPESTIVNNHQYCEAISCAPLPVAEIADAVSPKRQCTTIRLQAIGYKKKSGMEWVVHSILSHRIYRKRTEYLVIWASVPVNIWDWRDAPDHLSSWVQNNYIRPSLVRKFYQIEFQFQNYVNERICKMPDGTEQTLDWKSAFDINFKHGRALTEVQCGGRCDDSGVFVADPVPGIVDSIGIQHFPNYTKLQQLIQTEKNNGLISDLNTVSKFTDVLSMFGELVKIWPTSNPSQIYLYPKLIANNMIRNKKRKYDTTGIIETSQVKLNTVKTYLERENKDLNDGKRMIFMIVTQTEKFNYNDRTSCHAVVMVLDTPSTGNSQIRIIDPFYKPGNLPKELTMFKKRFASKTELLYGTSVQRDSMDCWCRAMNLAAVILDGVDIEKFGVVFRTHSI